MCRALPNLTGCTPAISSDFVLAPYNCQRQPITHALPKLHLSVALLMCSLKVKRGSTIVTWTWDYPLLWPLLRNAACWWGPQKKDIVHLISSATSSPALPQKGYLNLPQAFHKTADSVDFQTSERERFQSCESTVFTLLHTGCVSVPA